MTPLIRPIGTKVHCYKCRFEWKNKYKVIFICPNCGSKEFKYPIVKDLKGEVWHNNIDLKDHLISNYGRLKRKTPGRGQYIGKIIKGCINNDGYLRYNIRDRGIFAHILVAKEFIGKKPSGYECNHKDGNKLNNHVSNLEYCLHKDNMFHAKSNGFMAYGSKAGLAKLDEGKVEDILRLKSCGMNQPTLAKMFSVDQAIISNIINNKIWKHVDRGGYVLKTL